MMTKYILMKDKVNVVIVYGVGCRKVCESQFVSEQIYRIV
jgi:hypothetical protein